MNFEKYPFEKLRELYKDIAPNRDYKNIAFTIGEPQFETPKFILDEFQRTSHLINKYPKTAGEDFLRTSLINFNKNRFNLTLKPSQVLPTNGTREVLFNLPQFILFDKTSPIIVYPNPFYQIYEGAAIASRAKVVHLNLYEENGFLPDINEFKKFLQYQKIDMLILNSPNNPTASVMDICELSRWVELALEYDFVILNDECYNEIYFDDAPPSILQASMIVNNTDFKNVLAINSISKRSSAPGLRAGFIAGDENILRNYLTYRTYVGVASPLPAQYAAAAAWNDQSHVEDARCRYRVNFELAKDILRLDIPKATFYIWLNVGDGIEFATKAYKEFNLSLLPGSFLSRGDIGDSFVRIALVHGTTETEEGLHRIAKIL